MEKRIDKVRREYERVKRVFEQAAPEQVELMDGMFWETARIRVELDEYAAAIDAAGGRIRFNPKNPVQQKILPASKDMEKLRAAYSNILFKLSRALGVENDNEAFTGLEDFE